MTKGVDSVLTTTVGCAALALAACATDAVTLFPEPDPCNGEAAVVVFGGGGNIWLLETII